MVRPGTGYGVDMTTTRDPRPVRQGDVNETRTVVIGGVQDLSTVSSVVAHLALVADTTTRTELTGSVTDETERTVAISFGDETGWLAVGPTPGDYWLTTQVTFADGTVLTWPDDPTPDRLTVLPEYDPA
jgi:hypothetical protein